MTVRPDTPFAQTAVPAPSDAATDASRPWRLARNAFGRLVFTEASGTEHVGVAPVRAFPIAAPEEGVSIVGANGRELAWIDRLDELPQAERRLVDEALAEREFVPEIRRVIAVSTFATPSVWTVETDRGLTELVLEGEEDIRRLSRETLLIAAADGVQYRVADLTALDRPSRRLLERFL